MDTSGEQSGLMAETLIVLAGENAWSAARGFAQFSVRNRDVGQARYWRNVARGVLKRFASKLAISAEVSATPLAAPPAPPAAPDLAADLQVSAAALAARDALPEMKGVVAAAPAQPDAPAEKQEPKTATTDWASAESWKNLGRAPIPMRARRTFPMHAMAPEDAPARALVEDNAAEEMLIARAA